MRHQRGALLVGLLVLLAVLALAGQQVSLWLVTQMKRQAETDLEFQGRQFVKAIESYYRSPTGTRLELPPRLESLLEDHRRLVLMRHLRRFPVDPMTGRSAWGVIVGRLASSAIDPAMPLPNDGPPPEGIVGVFSPAPGSTLRRMDDTGKSFDAYVNWRFTVPGEFSETQKLLCTRSGHDISCSQWSSVM